MTRETKARIKSKRVPAMHGQPTRWIWRYTVRLPGRTFTGTATTWAGALASVLRRLETKS